MVLQLKKKKYPTCVSSDTHLYSLCPESKDMVGAGIFLIADKWWCPFILEKSFPYLYFSEEASHQNNYVAYRHVYGANCTVQKML